MRRKIFVLWLALAMVLALAVPALAAQVYVNGTRLQVATASASNTTLVPLRAIFQALGATVNWDGATQTVTAAKGQTSVKLQIGSQTAYVNGRVVTLQVPGRIIQGNTMVPLRFVSEALGASVQWNGAAQTITIVSPGTGAAVSGTLKVHYIDVGQADAILIQLPSGQNMLIDAGNNDDAYTVVNYLKSKGISTLDYVIGTHPHEDHIGGLDVVINSFVIGKVYLPRAISTTQNYIDALLAIKYKGLKVAEASGGVKLDVGQGATAELLAPNGTGYEELNDYSAVLRLTFGQTSFLFTGDAEGSSEAAMLRAGYNLQADVLKVGHHGSSSSTSAAFLKAVSPKYAVISVGKDNDYGHPHAETLAKLATAGIKLYRTDRQGTVKATSDGRTITFNTQPTAAGASPAQTGTVYQGGLPGSAASSGSQAAASVVIANIDLRAEIATIKNNGGQAVNISGWQLISERGKQVFTFPSGMALAPGAAVKVASGANATSVPGVLFWTKENMWNNDGDPGALYDAGGKLVSRYPR